MTRFFNSFKIIGIISNSLFFSFVLYAGLIYNKKFNSKRNHYLAVFMAINMVIYYLFMIVCAFSFFLEEEFFNSFLCLFFVMSPYLIGIYGNDYDKAKWYFGIQLFILLVSLVFVFIEL
ncbi:MAG: hypothetical protein FWH53_08425 [Leptospirales bacterium]|nr:hypothetical protein [Leptospirales bacterium]